MDTEVEGNPEHMEVYHFTWPWKPVPVKSDELASIWATWHSAESTKDLKAGSTTRFGIVASAHVEELFNHIAYLELEIERLHRRLSRT